MISRFNLMVVVLMFSATTFAQVLIQDWTDGIKVNGLDDHFLPNGGFPAVVQSMPPFAGSCQMVSSPGQSSINSNWTLNNDSRNHTIGFRYMSATQLRVAVLFRPDCGLILATLPATTNTAKVARLSYTCDKQLLISIWTVGTVASWFTLDDFYADWNGTDSPDVVVTEDQWEFCPSVRVDTKWIKVIQESGFVGWKEYNHD